MLGLSETLTEAVFVYLAPQSSYSTNLAKKMSLSFLQLSGILSGLKSVKIILSCSYFKFLGQTAVAGTIDSKTGTIDY